jgi:ketosteroid isomerase-like protein
MKADFHLIRCFGQRIGKPSNDKVFLEEFMKGKYLLILFFILIIFNDLAGGQTLMREAALKAPEKIDAREADRAAIRAGIAGFLNKDQTITDRAAPVDFELTEFEILFQADTALVFSTVSAGDKNAERKETDKYRLLNVFGKRNGKWLPVDSKPGLQKSASAVVSPEARKIILGERDKVWQAWFANDKAALEKAIPGEIVVISPGGGTFKHRAEILESSERFVKSGAKLVRLEFSNDEIQVYGSTIILYTNYLYQVESGGKKEITAGRATDMFVVRENAFVNVGWHLDSGK